MRLLGWTSSQYAYSSSEEAALEDRGRGWDDAVTSQEHLRLQKLEETKTPPLEVSER
jgi:hypothetical protein